MRATWRMGSWLGVPVVFHWTVLLGLPWMYYRERNTAGALAAFVALVVLLLAHETGHALVARWRSVSVHRITLYALHGLCLHDEPYDEEDDVLIAWGGVAAQAVLLVIALAAGRLMPTLTIITSGPVAAVFHVLVSANIFIVILNLIPIAPFDGAKAWRCLPIAIEKARASRWLADRRRKSAERAKARTRRLEADAQQITADIIDKLKRNPSSRKDDL